MVGLLHVRIYLDVAIHADGQRFLNKTHSVEINLDEFRTDIGIDFLSAELGVNIDTAIEEIVVSTNGELSASVL